MKKYIMPEIKVVKIATRSMIAISVGINQTSVDASNAQGRDSEGDWDEE